MVTQPEKSKLLIIGGTSTLAESIRQLAQDDDFEVIGTFRNINNSENFSSSELLNLEDRSSIEHFLAGLKHTKFRRIIILTGAASGIGNDLSTASVIQQYYETHLINTIYFIDQILNNLEESGNLIYLSSISATNSSFDCHYSAIKAGVSAYIKSRSRFLGIEQSAFSIAPSLIAGTRMFNQMSQNTLTSHMTRNKGTLITIEEVSKIIWAQRPDVSRAINGRQISVGNEY